MTDERTASVGDLLDYKFRDAELLRRALTHSSAAVVHNEGLACLGDRIHGVWVARKVFAAQPGADKGMLTWHINRLCEGSTQASVFADMGLVERLAIGGAMAGSDNVVTDKMAATAFEAIVAAIELDGGPTEAERFLERTMGHRVRLEISSNA